MRDANCALETALSRLPPRASRRASSNGDPPASRFAASRCWTAPTLGCSSSRPRGGPQHPHPRCQPDGRDRCGRRSPRQQHRIARGRHPRQAVSRRPEPESQCDLVLDAQRAAQRPHDRTADDVKSAEDWLEVIAAGRAIGTLPTCCGRRSRTSGRDRAPAPRRPRRQNPSHLAPPPRQPDRRRPPRPRSRLDARRPANPYPGPNGQTPGRINGFGPPSSHRVTEDPPS